MAWTRPDNAHSRLVLWAKILFPLAALAALSTLFLFSGGTRPEDAIPYADVDVADLVKEPRLTAPDFAGMTSDGASLTLRAAEARPGTAGSSNAGQITQLTGLLETPDGAHTDIAAERAQLDQVARQVLLSGGVVVANSTGYRVETQELSIKLDQTGIDSAGPITAIGPVGQIEAGSMHLGPSGVGKPTYVLIFKDKVRMLYHPTK